MPADGICVDICPRDAIEIVDEKAQTVQSRARLCIRCGQCVAVCPNEALELDALPGDSFEPRQKWDFSYEDLRAFLLARRVVRTFADKPVERAQLDKILDACAAAPLAVPPHRTGVLVIDKRSDLDELAAALVDGYDKLLSYFSNPFMRAVIRLKRGAETFHSLKTHAIGIVSDKNESRRRKGHDPYTYRAPALFLFHSSRWVAGYQASVIIAATYAMLADARYLRA